MIKFEIFEKDEIVILDEKYRNSSKVKVVGQSEPNKMFTQVTDLNEKEKWEVMTNRLTKIKTVRLKQKIKHRLFLVRQSV